jgi:hypothetical protein
MRKAIAAGANPNQADDRGYTPIHVVLMTTINPFWCGCATSVPRALNPTVTPFAPSAHPTRCSNSLFCKPCSA